MIALRTWACALSALGVLALAGCERRVENGLLELASELRADRLQRARAQQAATPPDSAAPLTEAVRSLADVVKRLDERQQVLADQQATLARELRQWTQLLVGSLGDRAAREGQALAERLARLEQQLAEQDARHREVEALITRALDHTATQLELFLQRMGTPAASPSPVQPAGGRTEPAKPTDKQRAPPDGESLNREAPGGAPPDRAQPAPPDGTGQRNAATDPRWPWYLLAGACVVTGLAMLRSRHDRAPVAIATEMQVPEPAGPRATAHGESPEQPEPYEVEELWTAAALLGEAVGRLRQSTPTVDAAEVGNEAAEQPRPERPKPEPREPEPAGPPRANLANAPPDEVFAIDELLTEAASTSTPVADANSGAPVTTPPPTVAAEAGRTRHVSSPQSVNCLLPVADSAASEQRVKSLLAADPRVLTEPPPQVEPGPGALQVSFALLPGLPPGERSLLEQRLRDIVA